MLCNIGLVGGLLILVLCKNRVKAGLENIIVRCGVIGAVVVVDLVGVVLLVVDELRRLAGGIMDEDDVAVVAVVVFVATDEDLVRSPPQFGIFRSTLLKFIWLVRVSELDSPVVNKNFDLPSFRYSFLGLFKNKIQTRNDLHYIILLP